MAVSIQQALRNHIVDDVHEYPFLLKSKQFYEGELIADVFDRVQQAILSSASEKELAALEKMMFSGIHFYLYVHPEDPDAHLQITIYNRG